MLPSVRLSSLFFLKFSFLVVTISWGVKTDFSTLHFTITKKMSFVAGTYAQARGTLLCHRVAHINAASKQKVVSSSLSINVRAGVRGRPDSGSSSGGSSDAVEGAEPTGQHAHK